MRVEECYQNPSRDTTAPAAQVGSRPEFQNPAGKAAQQKQLAVAAETTPAAKKRIAKEP
ncbi:MAG: hypothetical protein KY475_22190 [Planctomycetes bacterium]|nr:hypothetical protein [Planctomycetota bacterium]